MLGVALALAAALAWAAGAVVIRVALQHLQPTTATVVSLMTGLALTMGLVVSLHGDAIAGLTAGLLISFAVYGVVNFPLGRYFNFSSIRLLGVSRATPVFSAAPVVSTALAVTLLGEQLTPLIVIGALAIVVGMVLIVSDR